MFDGSWIQLVISGVLGWIAFELRGLRHDVGDRVRSNDCNRMMDGHCSRIDDVEDDTIDLRERVAKLEGTKK